MTQLINLNIKVSTERLSNFKDLVFTTRWSSDTENITKAQQFKTFTKKY